jgi:pimeloyl-ACP methyl ester carboxylesterase
MAGYRTHLVNVWTEKELGSVPSYTMVDSLLYLPEGSAPDVPRPGVVFCPGWAGYPYDPLARTLGPLLAEGGVAVLSLGLRRRGGEGQTYSPAVDGDLRDIKVGLDALSQHGVFTSVLVGQDVGATSVVRYAAAAGDNRVAGIALVDPIADMHDWLVERAGAEAVEGWMRLAAQTSYEMKSDLIRIDVDIERTDRPPLWIMQMAGPFLAWWSPNAKMRLGHLLEEVRVPVLAVGTEADGELSDAGLGRAQTEVVRGRADLAVAVALWAQDLLPRPATPSEFELVEVTTDTDRRLIGYLRTPLEAARAGIAVVVVHGLTTGPFSPMVKQFLPHYTDHGFTALAIETRRSGLRCVADSFPENDVADIDAFVDLLAERGYTRIVLVGASLGSQAISRYVARRHHPNVIAAVHLAPTADMPTDLERNIGKDEYERVTDEARRAVEAGRGRSHQLVYDVTERGPSRFHSRLRHFWRAASWLAWWGPDAATMHGELMAEVDVPVLLVTGTADDYSDQARIDFLAETAKRAPFIDQVWVAADHGLRGAEAEATAAVVRWLEDRELVSRQGAPPTRPLSPITGRLPGAHVYPAVDSRNEA